MSCCTGGMCCLQQLLAPWPCAHQQHRLNRLHEAEAAVSARPSWCWLTVRSPLSQRTQVVGWVLLSVCWSGPEGKHSCCIQLGVRIVFGSCFAGRCGTMPSCMLCSTPCFHLRPAAGPTARVGCTKCIVLLSSAEAVFHTCLKLQSLGPLPCWPRLWGCMSVCHNVSW